MKVFKDHKESRTIRTREGQTSKGHTKLTWLIDLPSVAGSLQPVVFGAVRTREARFLKDHKRKVSDTLKTIKNSL